MKKYIITLVFAIGFGMNLSAQSDGFFMSNNNGYRNIDSQMGEYPALMGHGLTDNQSAPLGSGLLLLGGMALGYAAMRRKN